MLGAVSITACDVAIIVTETHDFNNMQAGEKNVVSIVLKKDDRLDISISVPTDDIGIKVDGPGGQVAIPFTLVEFGNFIVMAEEDGVYVITIDNSYSAFNPRDVNLILKYPTR